MTPVTATKKKHTEPDWLAGGGDSGELIRATDWSAMPLGPRRDWPQSLRTSLNIMLGSSFPMAIFWGSELITFYNDACQNLIGRGAEMFGRSFADVSLDSWRFNRLVLQRVMTQGETVHLEDQSLHPDGSARGLEDVRATLSYSPIRAEDGRVGGVLVTFMQTSGRMTTEDQLRQTKQALESQVAATLRSIPDEVWTKLRCHHELPR